MDVFILILILILGIILFIGNVYIFAYYAHPEDSSPASGIFVKLIVFFAMSLCWCQILLLPLDVSNNRGGGLNFRMDIVWSIVYITITVFIFIIIPFISAFNECEKESTFCSKIKDSFCSLIATIIIVSCLLIISFFFLSIAEIPITKRNCSIIGLQRSNDIDIHINKCSVDHSVININVSFSIYITAFLSFASWFVFSIFGGIGIASLPLDNLFEFFNRPKKIKLSDLTLKKAEILSKIIELKPLALKVKDMQEKGYNKKNLFSANKREYNECYRNLKSNTIILQNEYFKYKIQVSLNDTSVLYYLIKLIIGFFSLVLSLLWLSHLISYYVIPMENYTSNYFKIPTGYPLISNFLLILQNVNLSFMSTIIFTILSVYLLICVVKGCTKFGMRFFLFFEIHPLVKENTYISSILFNIMLVLLASVSVTHFCVLSFKSYATMSDIDIVFSYQIRFLRFYKYFYEYNIFVYSFIVISIFSFLIILIIPNDSNLFKNRLKKMNKEEALLN